MWMQWPCGAGRRPSVQASLERIGLRGRLKDRDPVLTDMPTCTPCRWRFPKETAWKRVLDCTPRDPSEPIARAAKIMLRMSMLRLQRASAAHCTASAPAGMCIGVDGSVAARHTASATSPERVPGPVDSAMRAMVRLMKSCSPGAWRSRRTSFAAISAALPKSPSASATARRALSA
jgi:hypothetical protein